LSRIFAFDLLFLLCALSLSSLCVLCDPLLFYLEWKEKKSQRTQREEHREHREKNVDQTVKVLYNPSGLQSDNWAAAMEGDDFNGWRT
jgi:hypothetical protein